ncbi:laminin subunit beta-1-like isoform X2 [Stegodyphus dumicola]|uniref:laminin subunit beta-1-like isoform X2 n=1 Tax=Stegodyphus dumicola TaxID=202533 RepID=UPI0015A820B9|nr:laminin subunit beta-1-like isoform X2 [Stegodyphus dumicola]
MFTNSSCTVLEIVNACVFSQGSFPIHACEESSCYPATGNLLIGRENDLRASSTCGTKGSERYCIVSYLTDKKKCFQCETLPKNKNDPKLYHGIENIVSRIGKKSKQVRKWWQSENGVENVQIQLDLTEEFHFTHLIITFKTFRPAAMLIERSHDFGRTWKVYQYFAYDCAESFPGIPRGPRRKITDVVCDSQYSGIEPSTEGEVIFRVLPPNIPIDDPYSSDVQNLLKMTNLRINFTKLHTLGDNLLDSSAEIREKYYYAIYEMVVRGSCSCYGHASRCVAPPGTPSRPDMVHGQCECTHHTKGANCQDCEDFYNDLEWKPAIGRQTNACKRCNCNGHATKCHYDAAVFEATARQSGGVCDACEHNTMGRNCEHCKPFFYQDPGRDIRDPNICQACDCDPNGSLDEGICDARTDTFSGMIAGRCHCKRNVDGRRCDRCKNGYWNFRGDNPEGCETCSCYPAGTVGNACDQDTGNCNCKRNVINRYCNQCLPEYYGLDTEGEGCKPCDCDPGGSKDNNCDVRSGQCRCLTHINGTRCDTPADYHFAANLDYLVYEAELAKGTPDCQVLVREPYSEREATWTGLGFMRAFEGSHLEFDITDIPKSLEYDIVIRYEPQLPAKWEKARIIIERPGPVDPNGPCANTIVAQDDIKMVSLAYGERYAIVYPPACLEENKSYNIRLEFTNYVEGVSTPSASVLIDSIVFIPRIDSIPFFEGSAVNEYRRQEFERFRCGQAFYSVVRPVPNEVCKKYLYSIGFYVYDKAHECSCDPTGSESLKCERLGGQCRCKANVVGRQCDRCAPGTYGFGPSGCRPCDCNSVGSVDNFCDSQTGNCKCRPNTYGRQCDECQPGFWNYPNCQRCDCNGHAETCDARTGYCIACKAFTTGPKCDRCDTGYYGDPRIGVGIPCRPCPCPGTVDSGLSHANSCELDPRTQNVICLCDVGYAGERCDRCANNYYGDPTVPNGKCKKCDCNRNIDETVPGNCDAQTGECLKCLYNTAGPHCEFCVEGFYGDATRQECLKCVCNSLGTSDVDGYCDGKTGQCPCLPNVVGISCDRCLPNHWNISSKAGCVHCDCDSLGSYAFECNEFDGQCPCKPGHGGKKCDECQSNYWGNPHVQCYPCECNREGSKTLQCRKEDGTCICAEGISGKHCDICARGYTGNSPFCEPCGECFDNWDAILQELKDQTQQLLDAASHIKQTGITGAYSKEFSAMESKLEEVREILAAANITGSDVEDLQDIVEQLRQNLTVTQEHLDVVDHELENTTQKILDAKLALTDLRNRADDLTRDAQSLKSNATALQEANVEGAFNITKDAKVRSDKAESKVRDSRAVLHESEGHRRRTERLLERATDLYNQTFLENEAALMKISGKINMIEEEIPELNGLVCGRSDKSTDSEGKCDSLCGGAGCDKCGGLGCVGAVTRADDAFDLAKEAEKKIREKEGSSKELLEEVDDARKDADEALEEARMAFERAEAAKGRSENATVIVEDLLDKIEKFLTAGGAKPLEIRSRADETLKQSVSLEPEQITNLAREINDTIASLTNIDAILNATAGDLAEAQALKNRADRAKENAEAILDTAKQVLEALEEAREAQLRAQTAIEKANKDIEAADIDLGQIASETAAAQEIANKSVDDIAGMQDRLDRLKKKFTENERNAKKSAVEANVAGKLAEQAGRDAQELQEKYNETASALDDKAKVSGAAKERADRLRERAKKLAEDANGRLKELIDMEDEFDDNERRLKDFSKELDELNMEMEGHLVVIEDRSAFYRDCQT